MKRYFAILTLTIFTVIALALTATLFADQSLVGEISNEAAGQIECEATSATGSLPGIYLAPCYPEAAWALDMGFSPAEAYDIALLLQATEIPGLVGSDTVLDDGRLHQDRRSIDYGWHHVECELDAGDWVLMIWPTQAPYDSYATRP